MILRAARQMPIATLEEAATKLAGVAACFADQIGGLWTEVHGRHVPINTATAEFVLEVLRIHSGRRRTGGPTHHVPLVTRPGQSPVGACTIRVVPNEPGEAAFVLRASLEAPVFKLDPETLLALAVAVADAVAADEACLRPDAWGSGPASWAVLAGAAAALRGSVSRRCSQGILVVLHDGAPTDQTSEAKRRSEAELSRVLGDTEVRVSETKTLALASAGLPSAPPLGPSALLAPLFGAQGGADAAWPGKPVRAAFAGTALSLDIQHGSALPFAKSTGDQPTLPFDQGASPGHPRLPVVRAPAELSGTSLAVELPLGPALPFDPSAGHGLPQPQVPRAPSGVGSTSLDVQLGLVPGRPFDTSTGPGHPRPPVLRAPAEFSSTLPLGVELQLGPALPFDPSAGPGHPQPPVRRPPPEVSGTNRLAVEIPLGRALPFNPRPGTDPSQPAGVVPVLTLEQYAKLRARLMVEGEDDQQVWKEFGVASKAVKEALQARFAAQFRNDPAAQARFVELIQQLVGQLRTQSRKG